ncbi:MAG: NADH-dependent phenylglyoxylate dehydrogenase subunit gamma [bacterium ADurb.Bin243]|nr:MAG: NADH-dependent phenylglyoxylate dehydrogenase subunit gamma [bacterium ADurb.Bin243]HOD39920.1 2-oxoacid:acceptor oxidoreductase family protein [Candidatus Wallbacteria bacterium]
MSKKNNKFPLNLVIAGFGGQGVLLAGKLIAEAGLHEGREVSWIPSYGPEMRGGTANCTVILSDSEIGSPVVENPDVLMILNRPSMDKFLPSLKKDGICIYNKSIIEGFTPRSDVKMIAIPASEIADKIGSTKLLNMVLVGSFMANSKAFSEESLAYALKKSTSAKHQNLLPLNEKAILEGAKYI